jgi:diguanylate cyclase (GGDEF)-like protein
LERALVRAGFALAEGGRNDPLMVPDLTLIAVGAADAELESLLEVTRHESFGHAPAIVLLGSGDRDGVARALALGAVDAVVAPVHLGELCARLEARLRTTAELRRADGAAALKTNLLASIEEIATAARPEEMLETMTRRLGESLGAAHCACIAPSPDRRFGRLIAVHENPTLRGVGVDLFRYPEAVEAATSSRTVHAPEVLRDGLFLAHLAQWPDSPEVHEIESAAAVPLVTQRSVRAVVVIRTRRGDPPLGKAEVSLVEQLVNATAALIEREERRNDASRRQLLTSNVDGVTRCGNLDALDTRLREEVERVRRYGGQTSFALLDIDALRELTTRLGREAGDRFLGELGTILLRETRVTDFVARYGSDEFALIMPATSTEGARMILSRLAVKIAEHDYEDLVLLERPRLAAGLVPLPYKGIVRVEDLLAAAEAALQRGKNGASGSGRVGVRAVGASEKGLTQTPHLLLSQSAGSSAI